MPFKCKHHSPDQSMWLLFQPCSLNKRRTAHISKYGASKAQLRLLPSSRESPSSINLAKTGQNATFFLTLLQRLFPNSHLIGPIEYKAAGDWPSASCWPKVDSQGVGDAGSEKLQPHNCTMRLPWVGLEVITGDPFFNRNRFNYVNTWPPWNPLTMVLLCVLAFMDKRSRRRCASAVTPDNYTGNFVLTPALAWMLTVALASLLPQTAAFTNFTRSLWQNI